MNTTTTVSQRFANAVANHISDSMFPPHRGVIEIRNPFGGCRCLAAFGNDGYSQDDRTRQYAAALVDELSEQGLWDVDLGTSDDGYTWAIVVPLDDDEPATVLMELIEDALYSRYIESRGLDYDDGFVLARKRICDREILEHTGGEPLTISGWDSIN
jgi:hypothetical protein